jgi:hypothetical protein
MAAIIISLLIGGMLDYAMKRARRKYIARPNINVVVVRSDATLPVLVKLDARPSST